MIEFRFFAEWNTFAIFSGNNANKHKNMKKNTRNTFHSISSKNRSYYGNCAESKSSSQYLCIACESACIPKDETTDRTHSFACKFIFVCLLAILRGERPNENLHFGVMFFGAMGWQIFRGINDRNRYVQVNSVEWVTSCSVGIAKTGRTHSPNMLIIWHSWLNIYSSKDSAHILTHTHTHTNPKLHDNVYSLDVLDYHLCHTSANRLVRKLSVIVVVCMRPMEKNKWE